MTMIMVGVVNLVVPSLVPHPQLLTLEDAAQVLSDLINYTPPHPPPTLPSRVRSPAEVVRTQQGGGAECALVVASVLLGAGYRALVVQGAAWPSLVARDTSHLPCPYLQQQLREGEKQEAAMASKYSVRAPPDLRSQYLLIMEERAKRRRTAHLQQKHDHTHTSATHEQEWQTGSGGGETSSHLHFWVVVLPPGHHVTKPTFVEPTTGQVVPLGPPYLHIHAVFDHTNYWACTKYDQPISSDMFDLSDRNVWMALIEDGESDSHPPHQLSPSSPHHEVGSDPLQPSSAHQSLSPAAHHYPPPAQSCEGPVPLGQGTTSLAVTQAHRDTKKTLKVPRMYMPITITEEMLEERFPGGWREEVYCGVVVRRYSAFSHPRGATLILTLCSNTAGSSQEVQEKFEQRGDGLLSRMTSLLQGAVHETFANTRKDTLKRHKYWRAPGLLMARSGSDGMNNPAQAGQGDDRNQSPQDEVFEFHSKFRVDALRTRVIGKTVWREEFDDRPDLLMARTITFSNADPSPPRPIQIIEEEFGCPDGEEPHKAVQRRVFEISEGKILLVYHYGHHRLLQPTRSFLKPQSGRPTDLTSEMTQGFQPDPSVEEPGMPELWEVLESEMEAEVQVQEEVRRAVEETAAIREARTAEEHHIVLLPHIFDIRRNETVQYILKQRQYEEAHREEMQRKRQEEREGRVDTIAPYLPLLLGDSEGDRGEIVRERCLQDLRERLALRANLLQDRLDQARALVLECREEGSRRKRLTAEERAALTARTTAAEAAHRRLRAQLAAWRHEASERYETLAGKLESNLWLTQKPALPPNSTLQ
ncbi:dynein regulatory complex subunit 7 isoform X3 [Cherax quadricarinatus]|uniref:dynein regulatory complex subunit 7 isoform X3 n=1 Tax=Cherax quadricarinatus TaxID=27406 RepID=UPI00387E2250